MPTPSYTVLAGYLRPGHPVAFEGEGSRRGLFVYRGSTDVLTANKPAVGATWADGGFVTSTQQFELNAGSAISELTIDTQRAADRLFTAGHVSEEQENFEMVSWRPVMKALEVHPSFQAGGDFELEQIDRFCIIGWRAELDADLRTQFRFSAVNSSGVPKSIIYDIEAIAPNALRFLQYVVNGMEEFVDYMPIFQRRRVFKSEDAPLPDVVGMKDEPEGEIVPPGYEWVKSKDDIERIGLSTGWRRSEEWEGAVKVFYDNTTLY